VSSRFFTYWVTIVRFIQGEDRATTDWEKLIRATSRTEMPILVARRFNLIGSEMQCLDYFLLAFWIIVTHLFSPLTSIPATSAGVFPFNAMCGRM
jgi:hypothetical protein